MIVATDPKWLKRLAKLQDKLGLDLEGMAAHLSQLAGWDITVRAYASWRYGQRNPSRAAILVIEQAEQSAK